jgi:hypothetical protein
MPQSNATASYAHLKGIHADASAKAGKKADEDEDKKKKKDDEDDKDDKDTKAIKPDDDDDDKDKKVKGKAAKKADDDSDDDDDDDDDDMDKKKKKKKDDDDDDDDDKDAKERAELHGSTPSAKARDRERARCQAIFASSHASGRVELAAHLAFGTRQTASEAIGSLKHSPAPAAAEPVKSKRASLDEKMSHVDAPNIGTNAPAATGSGSVAQKMIAMNEANRKRMIGQK